MNHGVHHAKNAEYIDANYGGVFIIWDRMFGTYIPQRSDIKPIYGTVKPLNSWNPIWANFQVFYQMIQDTINTKKLSNKLKIWYGPTSWRPDDVLENNPDPDPAKFAEKFSPPLNREQSIFGIFQIFAIVVFAALVTVTVASQTYQETAIFGLIFVLTVLIISLILQNKENSFNIQLFFSIALILFIFSDSVVNSSLMASQFLIGYGLINTLYIAIGIPIQRYSLKESIN
jgi:drug/metabolite transporter superfamily protein YnfA